MNNNDKLFHILNDKIEELKKNLSTYDDSALVDRLDDLEKDVVNLDKRLCALEKKAGTKSKKEPKEEVDNIPPLVEVKD